ncbi:hypothetical protein GGX14DRAFT_384501 [Mycena pura]|uniref:Uncharacterized protein n=1 Tax=Mycena pura TaxID=153505 RepID=A0AAD6YVI4_9AGAR|nr:hypothetical protein GGX14DRAFT_384501 [Mycena pura]
MLNRPRSHKSTKPATRAPRAAFVLQVETDDDDLVPDAADPPPPITYPLLIMGIDYDRRDQGDKGDSPSSPINPLAAATKIAVPTAQHSPAAPPVASTSSRTAIASWRRLTTRVGQALRSGFRRWSAVHRSTRWTFPAASVSGMSANAREAQRREKHPKPLQPSLAETSPQNSPVRPRPMVPPSASLQAALNAACAALAVGGSSPEDAWQREDALNRVRNEMGVQASPEEIKFAEYLAALDAEKQRDEQRRELAPRKRAELEEQLQALEYAAAQKHAEAEQLHQALSEQLEIESRRAPSVALQKSKLGNGKVPVNSPEATVPPLKTETQSDWKTRVALQHWREGELADHGESRIPDQAAQASTSYANGDINPTQRVSSHSRVKMRYSTVPAPGGDPGGPSDSSDDERGRDPPPPRGPPNLSGHSGHNRRPAGNGRNPGGGGPSDPGGSGDPPGGNPFTWDPNDDTLPRRQDANTAVTSFMAAIQRDRGRPGVQQRFGRGGRKFVPYRYNGGGKGQENDHDQEAGQRGGRNRPPNNPQNSKLQPWQRPWNKNPNVDKDKIQRKDDKRRPEFMHAARSEDGQDNQDNAPANDSNAASDPDTDPNSGNDTGGEEYNSDYTVEEIFVHHHSEREDDEACFHVDDPSSGVDDPVTPYSSTEGHVADDEESISGSESGTEGVWRFGLIDDTSTDDELDMLAKEMAVHVLDSGSFKETLEYFAAGHDGASTATRKVFLKRAKQAQPRAMRTKRENFCLTAFVKINSKDAFTLFDSGCTTEACSPDFARISGVTVFPIEAPITLQLGTAGSRSKINHGMKAPMQYGSIKTTEYFDILNLDRFNAIIGTKFMCKHGIALDFETNTIRISGVPSATFTELEELAHERLFLPLEFPVLLEETGIVEDVLGNQYPEIVMEFSRHYHPDRHHAISNHERAQAARRTEPPPPQNIKVTLGDQLTEKLTTIFTKIAEEQLGEIKAGTTTLSEADIPRLRDQWMAISEDIMSGPPAQLPPLRAVNHRIPLIDDSLIYNYHLPRCADALKPQLLDKIAKYVKAGWWEPVQTDQAAPMLCIPKKTGKLRTALDARKRNANTQKDVTPFPDQDLIRMDCARAKYRSKIDLSDTYELMLPRLESMQIRLNSNYAMLLRHRSNPNPTPHKVQHSVLYKRAQA